MQVYLFQEREHVLRLYSENDRLKVENSSLQVISFTLIINFCEGVILPLNLLVDQCCKKKLALFFKLNTLPKSIT